jgi:TRAP-type C4-dicarboxylate transport system permease large subunit
LSLPKLADDPHQSDTLPFIAMQGVALVILFKFPQVALWLPKAIGW